MMDTPAPAPEALSATGPAQMPVSTRSGKLAEFLVVAFCTLAFAFTSLGVLHSLVQKDAAGKRDFVEYWAAGHQLALHANPYDADAMLAVEHSAGFPPGIPVMLVRNPPVVLPLLAPLGYLSPLHAEWVWCSLLLGALLLSIWRVCALDGNSFSAIDMLAVFFAPAICCLLTGQISMLVLLGLALFLFLHRAHPLLAGAGLAFCIVKPHLLLPFGVVLLLWVIDRKRYRAVAGAAVALSLAAAAAYLLDPHAWAECTTLARTSRAETVALPCFSYMLRRAIAPNFIWVQYLPALLGSLWALIYYRRNRVAWDWTTHGSILTLVSLTVAPYSWFTDQVALIPALLFALHSTRSRFLQAIFALASAGIQLCIFGGGSRMLHSSWLFWTAPFWLGWYLLAVRSSHTANQPLVLLHSEEPAV